MFSAVLQNGHVSGTGEVICHFTAFSNLCCCMGFEKKNIAKLKPWLQTDGAVGALRCPFQHFWCHYGNENNTALIQWCFVVPVTPHGGLTSAIPTPARLILLPKLCWKEAGEVRESVCLWPLCRAGAVPGVKLGLPASRSWAVPASAFTWLLESKTSVPT